jgi:hypothetical protein
MILLGPLVIFSLFAYAFDKVPFPNDLLNQLEWIWAIFGLPPHVGGCWFRAGMCHHSSAALSAHPSGEGIVGTDAVSLPGRATKTGPIRAQVLS